MRHIQKVVLFALNLGTNSCSCCIAIKSSDHRAMISFKSRTWKFWGYFTRITKGIKIKAIGEDNFVFQQDGAPPHWALDVRAYLNNELENYWMGRAAAADGVLLLWPPRSPDLTPLDFFLWGFVKGKVYYPPLTTSIKDLKKTAVVWQWPLWRHNFWRKSREHGQPPSEGDRRQRSIFRKPEILRCIVLILNFRWTHILGMFVFVLRSFIRFIDITFYWKVSIQHYSLQFASF